ncbi:MAG TPA: FKBP-type peptidyl-prolyl cis-trans isomerase [Chitinophagaceae bacterium]|nr:FKBP-type peptidyl-prolyl cis-trans isomerase [Chitinophagaceae bacterium]
MKKILIVICTGLITFAQAQVKKTTTAKTTKSSTTKTSTPVFKNSVDSFSYAIGLEGASYYKSQGITNVNSTLIKKAFDDVYGKKTLLLTPEQSTVIIQTKLMEYMKNKNSAAKEEGKKFLADNKKRAGVVELPNGLQYEIIKQGTGEKPKATDTIKAHYAGTLINGQEFDNSYKRGQPIVIPVGGVIQGWVQALQMMPVGSKWKLYIPSDLGYGERGAGGAIPGGAALIFEIELLEIVNRPK